MNLYKIFQSVDGEVNLWHQGRMCTFVRLSGCNLRCRFCDTTYAQEEKSGVVVSVDDIFQEIVRLRCSNVTLTGGEPLDRGQGEVTQLLQILVNHNFKVSVETNGSFPILPVPGPSWVMDYKLPSSCMESHMKISNFLPLGERDFVKFVICNKNDFFNAIEIYHTLKGFDSKVNFAFSPAEKEISSSELFTWMQEGGLMDCILSRQIHKDIWPNVKKGEER